MCHVVAEVCDLWLTARHDTQRILELKTGKLVYQRAQRYLSLRKEADEKF